MLAQEVTRCELSQSSLTVSAVNKNINADNNKKLPTASDSDVTVVRSFYTYITAYNSLPEQTDSTPCITASSFNVCEHNEEDVVAANFLPFGATIRIPEYFGDRIFTVQDRMHKRFEKRVDIWMKNKESAKSFGIRRLKVEIVKLGNETQQEIVKR